MVLWLFLLGLAGLLRQAFLRLWAFLLKLCFYFPFAGFEAVGLVLAPGLPGVVEGFGLLTPIAECLVEGAFVGLDEIYPVEAVADGSPGLSVVGQRGK